jgi:hypothetical protein
MDIVFEFYLITGKKTREPLQKLFPASVICKMINGKISRILTQVKFRAWSRSIQGKPD